MMQRLGLAQALIGKPKLLFLDEPTDGVDPVGRREIRDLLVSLRDEGMTIFLNSHLLSEVELVCSRVGILHRGRMVQTGTIAELTRGQHAYRIRFPSEDRLAIEEAFPELDVRREDGAFEGLSAAIDASTAEKLNDWIDRLRAHGIRILGIVPDQQSLEARFMEIIESQSDHTEVAATDQPEDANA
jgi:ABC-2 type transport system ATP-binding protein